MTSGPSFDPYAVLQIVPAADQEVVHAAYRALALKYHPDRDATRRAAQKMADLNRAYALLRDPEARTAHDRGVRRTATGDSGASRPGPMRPPAAAAPGSVLTFGRYDGWSLRDLARRDPEYLLWLSRHSSGIRYRTEIYSILHSMGVSAG